MPNYSSGETTTQPTHTPSIHYCGPSFPHSHTFLPNHNQFYRNSPNNTPSKYTCRSNRISPVYERLHHYQQPSDIKPHPFYIVLYSIQNTIKPTLEFVPTDKSLVHHTRMNVVAVAVVVTNRSLEFPQSRCSCIC